MQASLEDNYLVMLNIVADSAIPFVKRYFAEIGELSQVPGREISTASLREADVLVCRTVTRVDRELLAGTPIQVVACPTSGIDHVDLDYLDTAGIGFFHAPGCNANSVAEYVLSALFVLAEQGGIPLTKKRTGIIGCGNVGSRVCGMLDALGLAYSVYDPFLSRQSDDDKFCELEDISDCDIISLHVPLTVTGPWPTRGMLNADFLSSLKEDVILLNTARGGVLDEAALLTFLRKHREASAVIDVWEGEPTIDTELVQEVDLGTSHIAGYSMDAKLQSTMTVFTQVCAHFEIEVPSTALQEVFPDAASQPLRLSGDQAELDAISLAVLASYDVRSDAAALRRILELDANERGRYFSDLRNNYPIRREFPAMTIRLENESRNLKTRLLELGFQVTGAD